MLDVDSLVPFWDEMSLLDATCRVLGPLEPSHVDTGRRIAIAPKVSLQIRVDPRAPRELPEMLEFLGSEVCMLRCDLNTCYFFYLLSNLKVIEPFKKLFVENCAEWDANINIVYNLEELLQIKLSPKESQNEVLGYEFYFYWTG